MVRDFRQPQQAGGAESQLLKTIIIKAVIQGWDLELASPSVSLCHTMKGANRRGVGGGWEMHRRWTNVNQSSDTSVRWWGARIGLGCALALGVELFGSGSSDVIWLGILLHPGLILGCVWLWTGLWTAGSPTSALTEVLHTLAFLVSVGRDTDWLWNELHH